MANLQFEVATSCLLRRMQGASAGRGSSLGGDVDDDDDGEDGVLEDDGVGAIVSQGSAGVARSCISLFMDGVAEMVG